MDWTSGKMNQGRAIRKISDSKPDASRRRPKLRWLEDVHKDLREMKVKRSKQKAVDRKKWTYVIREPRLSESRRANNCVSIRAKGWELSNFLFEISAVFIGY
jgi:hypothetical protein